MKYTEVLGLRKPAQDEYYNVDDANYNMDKLDGAVAGTYAHSKGGTVHALTGAGSIIKFTATTNYADGDTWTVNGAAATALTIDGQPLHTGDIIAGSVMLAVLDGGKLQFQFRSYDAQLSNKANELDVIQHTAAYKEPNDLHSVTKGLLAVNPAGTGAAMTKNAPPGIDWGTCLSLQYGATRQLIAIDSGGQVFAQGNDSRGWSPWKQLATAEPPREYFLPVSGATVGGIYYKKNQFDELTVTCSMLRSTLLHNTETIATLPIGYRPKHSYSCPCIFHAPYIAGSVSIEVGGEIKIGFESDSTNVRNISFAISNMGVL